MASRISALAVLALASAVVGCSLPRGTITPPGGFDAGPGTDTGTGGRDVGPPIDGGGTCTGGCDDGNPCTDDACAGAGCTHTPNAATCDDGVLCNGGDTCGGGSCSVHDGVDPCPGAATCDATSDMCTGCSTASDCPAPMPGPWGTCDFGSDLCATSGGTQTRTVTGYTCSSSGTCEPSTTMEMQACTRPSTDGRMCAAPTYGAWGTCDFGPDPCTQAGVQVRTATTSHCAGGACVPTDAAETQPCSRSTDGMSCGTTTTSPWSTCMVAATCSGSGMQSRTTTTPTCQSGTCAQMQTSEMQACTPSGGTSACGTTTCSPWSACTQTMPGTCDRTGTQTRTCATPVCSTSGTCTDSTSSMEQQACNASVSGVSCTTTSCTQCRESGGGCRPGRQGTQRCSTTKGTCMDWGTGPFCAGLPAYTTRTCNC